MTRQTGQDAELLAARHLQAAGLTLRARNVQCRWGEIDLVMDDGASWVFVEVKARRSQAFGGGLAAVTVRKQQKLRRTAEWYLNRHRRPEQPCRFDVIDVNLSTHDIQWIRNAF